MPTSAFEYQHAQAMGNVFSVERANGVHAIFKHRHVDDARLNGACGYDRSCHTFYDDVFGIDQLHIVG